MEIDKIKPALLSILLFLSMNVSAQQMSFEQTVSYINEKMKCCSGKYPGVKALYIAVKKNGRLTIYYTDNETGSFNLLDLTPNNDCDGIWVHGDEIDFFTTKSSATFLVFESSAEANRVYKAFQHLRTLCKKDTDPFD